MTVEAKPATLHNLKPAHAALLLLLLTSFAWMPLLAPGYFLEAHDAKHTLFFLVEFDQALRDGALYPRWAIDQAVGYGYPLFVFYAPLAYYIAEAFHLLGFGITWAVKLTFLVAFAVGAVSTYALARELWGDGAGLLAALLFTYAPYHLVDVYVRCALAEFLAFGLIPLSFLSLRMLLRRPSPPRAAVTGFALGSLILAHQITALMTAPFLAGYALFELLRMRSRGLKKPLAALALAGMLALGVSAAYWLPMLFERSYIVQEQWMMAKYNYRKQFVYPFQLLDPRWGYGYAVAGPEDGMPLQVGILLLTTATAAIVLGLRRRERRGELLFWGGAAAVAILLTTGASAPVWEAVPLLPLVQFPWRFLALAVVALSLVGGCLPTILAGEDHPRTAGVTLVLALATLVAGHPHTLPQHTPVPPRAETPVAVIDFELEYPDMRGMTAWTREFPSESPLIEQYLAGKPLRKAHILHGEGEVIPLRHGGRSEEVLVIARSEVILQFYTYYYPGWRAYVDGLPVSIRPEGKYGLITLEVPPGEHRVLIRFEDTPLRLGAGFVSLASLLAGLVLLGWACAAGRGP